MLSAAQFGTATPITVHLDGTVSVRNRSTPYKGQMFAAYPGDIVFSKIDARSGAITRVPPGIARAVVTPEFPVFTPVPDRLDGEWLDLLLRSDRFLAELKSKATGTSGRKRVTPDAFLDLRIDLPPLETQAAAVKAHGEAMAAAAALEAQATAMEADAASAFEAALGLTPPPPLPERPLFLARFADLDRWSPEAALRAAQPAPPPAAWPMVRLGEVVADLENGWSPKCLSRPAEGEEWGVLKLGAVSFGVFNARENKSLPTNLVPRPSLEIKSGDVLISRANITRLVGATALVESSTSRLLLCDKIFRVVPKAEPTVESSFLAEALRAKGVRQQIESKLTGTSPTMKNISKPALLSLIFPLPPLDVQRALVEALAAAHLSATALRDRAVELRAVARVVFETAAVDPRR
jgi:type I restriction enzyme S subunit